MKSIRTKILFRMCSLVILSLLVLALVTANLNIQTTRGVLEQSMAELAELSSELISSQLKNYVNIVSDAGRDPVFSNPDATLGQKQAVLDEVCSHYPELTRGGLIGTDGIGLLNGTDYNEREYFKRSMGGQAWISDPLVAKTTGEMSVIISAPIWKDGRTGGTVVGVIFFVPRETFLTEYVSEIKVSDGAGAQIVNKAGTIVAHPDFERVRNQHNSIALAKSNPELEAIAALELDQTMGHSGFGTYTMGGVEKFLSYHPIAGTDGWSIGVNAPMGDFMGYTTRGITLTILLSVVAIVIAVLVSVRSAGEIVKPIRACCVRLKQLADGDLASEVPETAQKDETGALLRDLGRCVVSLREMVGDISFHLGAIADGDLTHRPEKQYSGDFDSINTSLERIIAALSETMGGISAATDQVADAADLVANAAVSIAQNSTEQSQTMTKMSERMSAVARQAEHTSQAAQQAASSGENIQQTAHAGNAQMEKMMLAVQEINDASRAIRKVIKAIDDIAFQTNILALNAAVEAARAGQYGKGFSVVANEVRSLASKSAVAAKDTAKLISDTIQKAEEGYASAQETAQSLGQILSEITAITELIDSISDDAGRQARDVDTLDQMLESQLSAVQQNSATSEETAAASEQMNGQAAMLREMVSHFQLLEKQ